MFLVHKLKFFVYEFNINSCNGYSIIINLLRIESKKYLKKTFL